ncbi:hypothetical protein [Streptomyces triculaminicus]|uniref:hypothetical protein n=1 Tax=Streptomyces triculaminicus TaxID=2816232 RepID=UPI003787F5E8
MSDQYFPQAACVDGVTPRPLTPADVTVIIIVVVLAVVLALTGMSTLSVVVLLAESTATGVRLARRLRATRLTRSGAGHGTV